MTLQNERTFESIFDNFGGLSTIFLSIKHFKKNCTHIGMAGNSSIRISINNNYNNIFYLKRFSTHKEL